MSGERVRYVAWGSAVAGGLIGFALIVAFVYFVDPPVEAVLAPAGKIVTFGIVLMLVTLLRVIAGMWTAQLTRRRHEARERTDFLPTAAVGGLIGWAVYAGILWASAAALRTDVDWPRQALELVLWVVEYGVGSLLVNPALRREESRQQTMV